MKSRLNNFSNLQQRIIAGLAGAVGIVAAILYSEWSFLVVFCLIGAMTQMEFYRLLGLDGSQPLTYYGTACGVFINVITFLIEKDLIGFRNYFLISPLVTIIFFIKLYKKKDLKPFMNIAFTFLGIIYV
ncbi:MAG: phosphatidate cytidylyltransferase, partial [Runella slithyformis]